MSRSLPALVLAAGAGAAVTYYLVAPHGAENIAPHPGDTAVADRATLIPPPATGVAERAEIYREAAQANGADIVTLLKAVAGRRPSPERSFELGVLLARYAEVDAEKAIAAARSVGAGAEGMAALYAQWASTNPAAALAALAATDDPATASAIGLAMLAPLGGDGYALRQIAAALPKSAERAFLVGAVAALAESDPATAVEQALALASSGLSGIALQRVATVLARKDPRAALARAVSIKDSELRATLESTVFREWAQFDLDGLFDYFRGLDGDAQAHLASIGALRDAARFDPVRALEIGSQWPMALRAAVEGTAVAALAERDLDAALQYVASMPAGQQQQYIRQSLARTYGKRDPDAALAWARSSGLRENLVGVLSGIVLTDVDRAFDVLQTLPPNDRTQAMQAIVYNNRDLNFEAVATRLLSSNDADSRRDIGVVLSVWSSQSLTTAVSWAMSNTARLPPGAFAALASGIVRTNPTLAEQYLAQLPQEARYAWIQGLAQGNAQTDPRAAAAWVQQFRNDPAYASAATTVARALARADAPAAAQLLTTIDGTAAADSQALASAAYSIGSAWARTDPRAAADWASGLPTDSSRPMGLGAIVDIWAGGDYPAAANWTLRLPSGSTRDAALGALLAVSRRAEPDATLLRAFSTDETRQNGLLGAVYRIAQRDPDAARAMAGRYLTEDRRRNAEQAIAQAERERRGDGPVFFSN